MQFPDSLCHMRIRARITTLAEKYVDMKLQATVAALSVRDKVTRAPKNACALLELTLEGIVGDVHAGFTKAADGRDTGVPRGTSVRNWRQWSAVSIEEMRLVAQRMGLAVEHLDPCLLSANLTFLGVPNFTQLPRGSSIHIDGDAILTVEEENEPCVGPGREISLHFPEKKPHEFVKAAQHLRGLVGVVFRAGTVQVGARAVIEVYEPRIYSLTNSIC